MTASFTILFAQLSRSLTNTEVMLSLTSILDFVAAAANIFSGQRVLTIASKGLEKR